MRGMNIIVCWTTEVPQPRAMGEMAIVSDTVPKLTGHQAKSLADYLHEHPESYQHLLVS